MNKIKTAQKLSNQPNVINENRRKTAPEEGDKLFGLGNGYEYFGDNAYYDGKLIEGADGSRLENVGLGYAKDDKHVYYLGVAMDKADAETFEQKYPGVFMDKNGGYYMEEEVSLEKAEDLIKFLSSNIGGEDLGGNYKKFSNRIYFWDTGYSPQATPIMVFIDANPNTFQVLKNNFAKDNNFVYYGYELIEGIDPSTFKVIGIGSLGKDDKSIVFKSLRIEGSSSQSFKIIREKECFGDTILFFRVGERHFINSREVPSEEFSGSVKGLDERCFNTEQISRDWKLVSGNPDDFCTSPKYSGDVKIRGWYEWGTNYVTQQWLFRVDPRDREKLIGDYNGLYSLSQTISDSLEVKLKKANKKNQSQLESNSWVFIVREYRG